MPAKQPKKGKGKKVTVVPDPTSAPASAPNPEVQAVLDAHIANVGSEHFPAGYFPIPYTLTPPDAECFPQLPPLRQPLEAALFGKWDQPGNPYLVWRIDATRVNFALTTGVLSTFCFAVMGRYPTTLAVELKLSQVTLAGLNKTLKLCTAAASKEFVNVLAPPRGLNPEEQWLWVDPVKKSGWAHRTATDAVVRYQTVKVQVWDAVAATEFSTNRRLRTHIPDITHPTLYTTNAPFTMLGMGCPHPSFHNSYPVATHDIPNPPIVTQEGFAAAGYRQYDHIIPEDLWARPAELATVKLNPSMLEEVDLQAPKEGGGRYQTTVSSVPHWLPDDLWQAVLAVLGFSLPPLEGLEALGPKIIERWEAEGFQTPHHDFALSVKNGGVLVRCALRHVRAGARGRPHGLDGNGPLHAAPELPGRRDVGPRPRGPGTPCHLLLRREGVPARCSACTRFCHTSHVTRCIWRAPNTRLARQLRRWRAPISILACANSAVGARRVTSWRAKYPVGARQVQFWRLVWFYRKRCCVAGFCVVLVVALVSLCAFFNASSV